MPEPCPRRALQALANETHAIEEERSSTEEREENEIGRRHRGSIAGYRALSARR